MNRHFRKRMIPVVLSALIYIITVLTPLAVFAAPDNEAAYKAAAEERKELPIQSNQITNWPTGPAIGAGSAILLEANTGAILYSKNIHEKSYPASTTKLLTCLIAAENAKLNETVSFSHDAVFSIERDSSNIGIDPGQAMPMEDCLYAILVASANGVANGVAEHIGGDVDSFADMMNKRASELGCVNSHFVNAHGLYDDEHYTTAYDLALIARAFFDNELLSKVGNTASYHFEATSTQPDDFIVRNKHKLITGEIACEGIKGGKTGYTDEARQTLVSCAEKNGMKLICVVMVEETPDQFYDTVKLFDYGFNNFTVTNVYEHETNYRINGITSLYGSHDVFGNSDTLLTLNTNSYIILPNTLKFHEITSRISYENLTDKEVARIIYSHENVSLGTASVNFTPGHTINPTSTPETNIVYINVKLVLIIIVAFASLLIAAITIRAFIADYKFGDIGKKPSSHLHKKHKRKHDKGLRF